MLMKGTVLASFVLRRMYHLKYLSFAIGNSNKISRIVLFAVETDDKKETILIKARHGYRYHSFLHVYSQLVISASDDLSSTIDIQ